jgi:hypothetical protein
VVLVRSILSSVSYVQQIFYDKSWQSLSFLPPDSCQQQSLTNCVQVLKLLCQIFLANFFKDKHTCSKASILHYLFNKCIVGIKLAICNSLIVSERYEIKVWKNPQSEKLISWGGGGGGHYKQHVIWIYNCAVLAYFVEYTCCVFECYFNWQFVRISMWTVLIIYFLVQQANIDFRRNYFLPFFQSFLINVIVTKL